MSLINIGHNNNDEHYRYKMPRPKILIEKGIRTAILNVNSIALSLHVPYKWIAKFISLKLQTLTRNRKGILMLNGIFDESTISNVVEEFVKIFVLCNECYLPELQYKKGKTSLRAQCMACGHKFKHKMDGYPKMIAFILNIKKN